VNNQDSIPTGIGMKAVCCHPENNNPELMRVAIHVAGSQRNIGIDSDSDSQHMLSIQDSDVTVIGGQQATGVNGAVSLSGSTVSATGAVGSNTGIYQVGASTGSVSLINSQLVAMGGQDALGLLAGDEDLGGPNISGSKIAVFSDGSATGISCCSYENSLSVVDSGIRAVGGTRGTAVERKDAYQRFTFDRVDIYASHVGIAFGEDYGEDHVLLLQRSKVVAGDVAVEVANSSSLQVEGSILKAARWLSISNSSGSAVTDSVLDGAASYGTSTVSCLRVYDRAYNFLTNTCPAP
jgi:hypothetical protein